MKKPRWQMYNEDYIKPLVEDFKRNLGVFRPPHDEKEGIIEVFIVFVFIGIPTLVIAYFIFLTK